MKKIDVCRTKRRGGFTLVELIVVLVMMAVLASVAVPTYLGYVDDNKAKECAKNREMLAAYASEMHVMNSSAGMQEAINTYGAKIKCPSGGTYLVKEGANNTVYCSHEGHEGETTVILKSNSMVTAQATYETEAPETEPATTPPENIIPPETASPPEPEADPPVEPKFEITLTPESTSMEVDGEKTFTVSITQTQDCTPTNTYSWTVSDNLETIENNNTSITVKAKALSEGSATITCRSYVAVEGGDSVPAAASATVTVQEKSTKLLKNVPDPLLINGNQGGINMSEYVETEGGIWSTNSSNIVCSGQMNNHWIAAKAAGECEYTYTLNGESESVEARVVYPIRGFYSTTNTNGVLTMKIGDSNWEFPANSDPGNTTDVSANWVWNCSGEDGIISYSLNPEKTKATVTALSEGYVELEVAARSEYETWQSGSDVWKSLKWKINVIDPNKLTGISVNNMGMKVNDVRQIQVNCNPSDANREGISFVYSGYGDCVSIDTNGNIKAEKKGSTTVTVQARKNGKDLEGISCMFNVAVTDLQSIVVEPQNVNVKSGETTTAEIIYTPEGADISQVNFELGGYDSSKFNITKKQDGILEITGFQACSDQWIEVKAYFSGEQVANCNFKVNVTSENNGDNNEAPEPTGISLEIKNNIDLILNKPYSLVFVPDKGDIIIHPIPEDASLEGYRINSVWGDNISYNNGIVKPTYVKEMTLNVQIQSGNGQKTLQTSIPINVISDPDEIRTFYINGHPIETNAWSVLRKHLNNEDTSSGTLPQPYLVSYWENGSYKYYVLKPTATFEKGQKYDGMSFETFLNQGNNKNQFVEVYTNDYKELSGQPYFAAGSVTQMGGIFYVSTQIVNENVTGWTADKLLEKGFIPISQ